MKVCTACWEYVSKDVCDSCGDDSELSDESDLIAAQRVLLWMFNDGEDLVAAFISDVCDWDKVTEDDLGEAATWRSFRTYVERARRPLTQLPDGTRIDDPSIGSWVIDDILREHADILRSID